MQLWMNWWRSFLKITLIGVNFWGEKAASSKWPIFLVAWSQRCYKSVVQFHSETAYLSLLSIFPKIFDNFLLLISPHLCIWFSLSINSIQKTCDMSVIFIIFRFLQQIWYLYLQVAICESGSSTIQNFIYWTLPSYLGGGSKLAVYARVFMLYFSPCKLKMCSCWLFPV